MSDQVSQPDEQAKALWESLLAVRRHVPLFVYGDTMSHDVPIIAAALREQATAHKAEVAKAQDINRINHEAANERTLIIADLRAELENQNRFLGLVIAERDQLQQRLDAAERELEHVKTVEFPKKAEAVAKANRLAALREVKADVDRRLSCLVDFGGQSVRLIESELKSVADVIAARIEKAKP